MVPVLSAGPIIFSLGRSIKVQLDQKELTKRDCTKIIISLLRGSGYNPAEHVVDPTSKSLGSSAPKNSNIQSSSRSVSKNASSTVTSPNDTAATPEADAFKLLSEIIEDHPNSADNISVELTLPAEISVNNNVEELKDAAINDINLGMESSNPTKVRINKDIVFPIDSLEEFDIGSELGSAPTYEPSDGTHAVIDAEKIFFNLDNIDDELLF